VLEVTPLIVPNGGPAGLADDIRADHDAALQASLTTLQSSIVNDVAYLAGGQEVVESLARLDVLVARIRISSGLTTTPAP
jgi:hypothetical protein